MSSRGNVFLAGVALHASVNASIVAGLGGPSLAIFGLASFILIGKYGEPLRRRSAPRSFIAATTA